MLSDHRQGGPSAIISEIKKYIWVVRSRSRGQQSCRSRVPSLKCTRKLRGKRCENSKTNMLNGIANVCRPRA